MNERHLAARIAQCVTISALSHCPRRKFGALLLDEARNVSLMDAYNGGPRGGGKLCGADDLCLRDRDSVPSGERIEVGCHHAEMNLICNAAASGIATAGKTLICTGEPCMMCAKLIHHAGIAHVIIVRGGYIGANGVGYLRTNHVRVSLADGPQDPRSTK